MSERLDIDNNHPSKMSDAKSELCLGTNSKLYALNEIIVLLLAPVKQVNLITN